MLSKSVEQEAFIKSLLLFFSSMAFLLALLFFSLYAKEKNNLDSKIFSQMRTCSFELKCPQFKIDFVDAGSNDLYILKKSQEGLYALFPISGSSRYFLKILYPYESYDRDRNKIEKELLGEFLLGLLVLGILSILFSLYAIHPLRQALKLTEEFVRDILHDFNTPLSIIRLNVRMLEKECPKSRKSIRIEEAVETLLRLQANLRGYLGGHEMQVETFRLDDLVKERVELIKKIYPDLVFSLKLEPIEVKTGKDAMIRIIDNVIGNAAKYNVKNGHVNVIIDSHSATLSVEDSGIGIEHPEKIFARFYKEHDRGAGIGLHIVKKLCDEMGIAVRVESEKNRGTTFVFDIGKVTIS